MRHIVYSGIAGAALALTATTGHAASLSYDVYDKSDLQMALDDRAAAEAGFDILAEENFESYTPVPKGGGSGDSTPILNSPIGLITTDTDSTCGGSCDAPMHESLIRSESGHGRYNTTENGANWLDSNDNGGINFDIFGLGEFNSLSFFLTDVDDVGPVTFSMNVDNQDFDIAGMIFGGDKQMNGALSYVRFTFDEMVSTLSLNLNIDGGDGFGIDDIRVANVAAVPVPAAGLLMLGALGGLGALRRKRNAA